MRASILAELPKSGRVCVEGRPGCVSLCVRRGLRVRAGDVSLDRVRPGRGFRAFDCCCRGLLLSCWLCWLRGLSFPIFSLFGQAGVWEGPEDEVTSGTGVVGSPVKDLDESGTSEIVGLPIVWLRSTLPVSQHPRGWRNQERASNIMAHLTGPNAFINKPLDLLLTYLTPSHHSQNI